MPVSFKFAIGVGIVFVIALGAFFALRKTMYASTLRACKIGLFATPVAILGLCLAASYNHVGTKEVGIPKSFGKPESSVGNGLHWLAPWKTMATLDGAIQVDPHEGQDAKDTTPCTTTRIAHESLACVDNTIRWRIVPGAADRLYKDYKDLNKIRDGLVTRRLSAAINEVFKDIDPLATDDKGNSVNPSYGSLADEVETYLRKQVGHDIEVMDITIPVVRFDPKTQDRIDAFQAEVASTRIAEQKKQTAKATAEANRILAGSVSKDPNVIVADCYDTVREMIKQKLPVPTAYNCWPGSGSAVVVPSTK
jgi:regulator of protease activity HflC (stomatin/prohibitin superfamily)